MKSKINPHIFYTGNDSFDPHDLNRPLVKYEQFEIQAPDSRKKYLLDILIGNKNLKEKEDLCFFYLYSAESKHRLGLFEIPLDQLSRHIDADGDLLPPSKPLLFPFVTSQVLDKVGQVQEQRKKDREMQQELQQERPKPQTLIQVKKQANPPTLTIQQQPLYRKLHKSGGNLPIETETEAKQAILEYKALKQSHHALHWLNERMKSVHYTVSKMDSLLHLLETILGKDLKEFLANHPDAERQFQQDQALYSELESLRFEQESRLDKLANRLSTIAQWLRKGQNEPLKQEQLQLQIDQKQTQIDMEYTCQDLKMRVPYMKNISTPQQYRNYIQSPAFQFPDWALQLVQEEFNMVCLFFRRHLSSSHPEKISTLPLDKKTRPDFFLILTLEQLVPELAPMDPPYNSLKEFDQVGLVEYKNHKQFTFDELPYSVKCLASQNMESTPFRFLPDFAHFTGMTVPFTEKKPHPYAIIFPLNAQSVPRIPQKKWILFRALLRNPQWYRIIADDYPLDPPLSLDGHLWATVTHYVQAGHFPDKSVYYLEFVQGESWISKSAELAKMAAERPGVYRKKRELKNDSASVKTKDFEFIPKPHLVKIKEPNLEERRRKALRAKFAMDPVKRSLLVATLDAILLDDLGREDRLLMQVRQECRGQQRITYN